MELSSSEMKTIQHQYDALAKKVLKGEARSYYRELSKRAALEVNFSEMSEAELSQLYTLDEYESDYYRFEVSGYDVLVKNELLGEALQALPEKKRDIILLSYFLDMSDEEIGGLLNVVRSKSLTIYSIQKAATAGGLSAAATERSMSCPAIRHFTASRLQNTIADYRKIIIATGT